MEASFSPASRVLITGAGGFVGRWLRQALFSLLSADALALSTQTHPGEIETRDPRERIAALDVRDRSAVDALVADFKPTAIVHLAALSSVHEALKDARSTWDVNLGGTMNLADSALRHSPKARFVFISSSEIYGGSFKSWNRPLDESALLDPANPYAASKAAADLLLGQKARDGLNVLRIRPFNHTGPGQTERFVIPAMASQIARIKRGLQDPVLHVGNLEAERDFLDVRDVVDAYILALTAPDDAWTSGAILNIASGIARRIGDVLEQLIALAEVVVAIAPDAARMRPSDTPVAVGDAASARQSLGWAPKVPWRKTLGDILAAADQNLG